MCMTMKGKRKTMFPGTVRNKKGVALIEFCFILPILIIMILFVIDAGRLIQARLIITNVAREGGNLASRGLKTGSDLIALLQSSATPLDLKKSGMICVSRIEAGQTQEDPDPSISEDPGQLCVGDLTGISSGIRTGADNLGLTKALYDHLVFNEDNQAPDIYHGVTIVETFYKYRPITPLPKFITNIFLTHGDGTIVGSRAVYCTTQTEL